MTRNLAQPVGKMEALFGSLGTSGVGAFEKIGGAGERFGGLIKGLAAGAVLAVGYGIARLAETGVKDFVSLADSVRQFKNITGESAQNSSIMVAVLKEVGVNANIAGRGFLLLATNTIKHADALKAMGIEVAKTSKGQVDLKGTLENVADAYKKTEDPIKRAQILTDTFGARVGRQLIPVLQLGKQKIDELFKDAGKHAPILSDKDLDNAFKFKIAAAQLGEEWEKFKVTIGEHLVPVLLTLFKDVEIGVGFIHSLFSGVHEAGQQFGILGTAMHDLGTIFSGVLPHVVSIGAALVIAGLAIKAFHGLVSLARPAIGLLGSAITKLSEGAQYLVYNFKSAITAVFNPMTLALVGIGYAANVVFNDISNVNRIAGDLTKTFDQTTGKSTVLTKEYLDNALAADHGAFSAANLHKTVDQLSTSIENSKGPQLGVLGRLASIDSAFSDLTDAYKKAHAAAEAQRKSLEASNKAVADAGGLLKAYSGDVGNLSPEIQKELQAIADNVAKEFTKTSEAFSNEVDKLTPEVGKAIEKMKVESVSKLEEMYVANTQELNKFPALVTSISAKFVKAGRSDLVEPFVKEFEKLGPKSVDVLEEISKLTPKELVKFGGVLESGVKAAKKVADFQLDKFPPNFTDKMRPVITATGQSLQALVVAFDNGLSKTGPAAEAAVKDLTTQFGTLEVALGASGVKIEGNLKTLADTITDKSAAAGDRIKALKEFLSDLGKVHVHATADVAFNTSGYDNVQNQIGSLETSLAGLSKSQRGRQLRGGSAMAGGTFGPGDAVNVGERGPEIFIPRTSGDIAPNDLLQKLLRYLEKLVGTGSTTTGTGKTEINVYEVVHDPTATAIAVAAKVGAMVRT